MREKRVVSDQCRKHQVTHHSHHAPALTQHLPAKEAEEVVGHRYRAVKVAPVHSENDGVAEDVDAVQDGFGRRLLDDGAHKGHEDGGDFVFHCFWFEKGRVWE